MVLPLFCAALLVCLLLKLSILWALVFGLLLFLLSGLLTSLLALLLMWLLGTTVCALEIVIAKRIFLFLLLALLVQFPLVFSSPAKLAKALIAEINDYQYNDGQGYQTENDESDDEFNHDRFLVCFNFLVSDNG